MIYEGATIVGTNADILNGTRLNSIPYSGTLTLDFSANLNNATNGYTLTIQKPGGDVPVDAQPVLGTPGWGSGRTHPNALYVSRDRGRSLYDFPNRVRDCDRHVARGAAALTLWLFRAQLSSRRNPPRVLWITYRSAAMGSQRRSPRGRLRR